VSTAAAAGGEAAVIPASKKTDMKYIFKAVHLFITYPSPTLKAEKPSGSSHEHLFFG
jgi:hypothetical protein